MVDGSIISPIWTHCSTCSEKITDHSVYLLSYYIGNSIVLNLNHYIYGKLKISSFSILLLPLCKSETKVDTVDKFKKTLSFVNIFKVSLYCFWFVLIIWWPKRIWPEIRYVWYFFQTKLMNISLLYTLWFGKKVKVGFKSSYENIEVVNT